MRDSIGRVLGGLAVLVLTATACSSGGAEATSPSPSPAASPTTPAASPTTPAASPTTSGDCATLAGLSGTVQDHGTAAVSGTSVQIDAGDFFFDPTCLTVSSAATVRVTVTNTGNALHNFTVEEQGIDQDVQIGESVTVKVKLPASGSLPFLCKYHSGSGMLGAFVLA